MLIQTLVEVKYTKNLLFFDLSILYLKTIASILIFNFQVLTIIWLLSDTTQELFSGVWYPSSFILICLHIFTFKGTVGRDFLPLFFSVRYLSTGLTLTRMRPDCGLCRMLADLQETHWNTPPPPRYVCSRLLLHYSSMKQWNEQRINLFISPQAFPCSCSRLWSRT